MFNIVTCMFYISCFFVCFLEVNNNNGSSFDNLEICLWLVLLNIILNEDFFKHNKQTFDSMHQMFKSLLNLLKYNGTSNENQVHRHSQHPMFNSERSQTSVLHNFEPLITYLYVINMLQITKLKTLNNYTYHHHLLLFLMPKNRQQMIDQVWINCQWLLIFHIIKDRTATI